MKKLYLLTTFILFLCAPGFSNGEIIEKNTQRYFKLGDKEYICNTDNKISDESAKEILKDVQKAYLKPRQSVGSYDSTPEEIVEIWNSLHKVYSGGIYDQILFVCLKYKLNQLFEYLKGTKKESKTKKYLLGNLLYYYWYAEILKKGEFIVDVNGPTNCIFYRQFVAANTFKMDISDGFQECISFDIIEIKTYATDYTSEWERKQKEEMTERAKRIFEDPFRDKIEEYTIRASNIYSRKLESLLKYFIDQSDVNSFIYASEWDQLIIQLPKLAMTLPKGSNGNAMYDEESVKIFAAKILELSLEYLKTNKNREELVMFGKNHSLKFKMTHLEKDKAKPLF